MVDSRAVVFLVAVAVFLVALTTIVIRSYRRAVKSSDRDWEFLLKRLQVVNRSSIAEVALDIIDESGQQRKDEGVQPSSPSGSGILLEDFEGWKC